MNVVIMGATSHIAKGLIERFLQCDGYVLQLYSRSADAVRQFMQNIDQTDNSNYCICDDYQSFIQSSCDVIINCIGVETRNSHNCDFTRYFSVTEEFDSLAISYLKNSNPEALYISFSSGAVYGRGFSDPAGDDSTNCIKVNHLTRQDYYGIVRINAEAKHRAHEELRIIDLRIFSYFSRYINLTDGYFITDLIQALLSNTVLYTDSINIVRDYLHPDDLFGAVSACISSGRLNLAVDINSSRPVAKQEILDYFSSTYGLRYEKRQSSENISATGTKANYYSTSAHASRIGFVPKFSSMDSLMYGAESLLRKYCQ